jgi:hypothetical protein
MKNPMLACLSQMRRTMTKSAVCPSKHLRFPAKVRHLIARTERHLALCYSPKRTEFTFCALLAAWESIALHDSEASHWFDIWQRQCLKRHHGKTGRTLADPVNGRLLSERSHVPRNEVDKAYRKVRDGMQRVFEATLHHYFPEECDHLSLATRTDEAGILFLRIRASFKTAKEFACPEGLEFFLLALIELFEESLGAEEPTLLSRKLWTAEIRRRRLGGCLDTKTLADVAPAKVRLERQKFFSKDERNEILRKLVTSVRSMKKELEAYLAT